MINGTVTGGNVGMSALIGGIGAGIGSGLGYMAGGGFWPGLGAAVGAGAASGAIGAAIAGGNVGEGAWMGAAYSTVGYLASRGAQSSAKKSKTEAERQSLQRKMADTQAILDEGYAQGGAEGQIKISVDILSVTAPTGEVLTPAVTNNSVRQAGLRPNWRAVGWGATEILAGVSALAISVAASAATSGAASIPMGWAAYTGIMSIGTGVADVVLGIYGEPTAAELVGDSLKKSSIGTRFRQFTPEFMP